MPLEIKVDDRQSRVEIIQRNKDFIEASIDGRVYKLDVRRIGEGGYSILHDNKSYNIDLVNGADARHFIVSMGYSNYDVHIIDAQARYMENRHKNHNHDDLNIIASPMPGKVVKIVKKKGDKVKEGEAVIVISAMKMESEYKALTDGTIKQVNCNEGDTVEANAALVVIE